MPNWSKQYVRYFSNPQATSNHFQQWGLTPFACKCNCNEFLLSLCYSFQPRLCSILHESWSSTACTESCHGRCSQSSWFRFSTGESVCSLWHAICLFLFFFLLLFNKGTNPRLNQGQGSSRTDHILVPATRISDKLMGCTHKEKLSAGLVFSPPSPVNYLSLSAAYSWHISSFS